MQYALNRIKTPDGTILTSYSRYDYKTHKDKNGEEYMVDGGLEYLRRNVNKEPYEELLVPIDASFEKVRESFHWGTYGKDGNQSLQWKLLKDITDNHLEAILKLPLSSTVKNLMEQEKKYREET